jgi:uncharacterized membrane protein
LRIRGVVSSRVLSRCVIAVAASAALGLSSLATPLAAHSPAARLPGVARQPTGPPAYRVIDIGTLQEGSSSIFRGINNAGHVTGGSGTFGKGHRAFMLSSTQLEAIALPSTDYSAGFGINDLGEVVGSVNDANAVRGFVWSRGAGMRLLPPLPGDTGSEAFAISGRSEVVGISSGGSGVQAVGWSAAGVPQALGALPGQRASRALGINDRGDVVGYSQGPSGRQAVRWRKGAGPELLGALGGHQASEAVAINASGDVVGWSGQLGAQHAVLWQSSLAPRDLGTLPGGSWSRALGLNGPGEVVGTSSSFLGPRAFRWTAAGGMQDLNDLIPVSDFVVVDVAGINDAGVILVTGRDELPNAGVGDHNHEFPVRVFYLVPTP